MSRKRKAHHAAKHSLEHLTHDNTHDNLSSIWQRLDAERAAERPAPGPGLVPEIDPQADPRQPTGRIAADAGVAGPARHGPGGLATTLPVTPNQQTVADLHAQGLTDRQISERSGISLAYVQILRSRLRLPVHSPQPAGSSYTDDQVRADWLVPLTPPQAAALRGCSVSTVVSRRQDLGLPRITSRIAWAMRCEHKRQAAQQSSGQVA